MSSDESSEPEDDSFVDEVEQAKMQDGAVSIRALQAGVIRAGVELDSEAVGKLGIGEVFEVLEEATTSDGNSRLRMERGWVSMTARSGMHDPWTWVRLRLALRTPFAAVL